MARKRSKPVEHKKPPEHHEPHKAAHEAKKPEAAAPAQLHGTEMPDDLRSRQQQAAAEPPRPVKLGKAKDDAGRDADAPPVPPKAAPDPAPRVIDQSERSPDPEKLSRFKIRATAPFAEQPYRYVLAPKGDKQAAIDCYLHSTGLQAVLDAYPEGQKPNPQFHLKELVD
jgi:hypothetical protein